MNSIMNKKPYSKPVVNSIRMNLAQIIATSPGLTITDDSADPGKAVLGNGRRGSWGDLWDDEE